MKAFMIKLVRNLLQDSFINRKKAIKKYRKDKSLDICCGYGDYTNFIGIDNDENCIKFAREHHNPCFFNFLLGSALDLSFKAKSFNQSMLIDCLHHFKDKQAVIKEAKRVSNEVLIIEDIKPNFLLRWIDKGKYFLTEKELMELGNVAMIYDCGFYREMVIRENSKGERGRLNE